MLNPLQQAVLLKPVNRQSLLLRALQQAVLLKPVRRWDVLGWALGSDKGTVESSGASRLREYLEHPEPSPPKGRGYLGHLQA